jgi:DNA polymerase-3 subunit alpha
LSKFVSLHSYSQFSLLHSLLSPKDIILRAKELGQDAVGIADTGSLAYTWDALKAARDAQIKLIVGCEFFFLDNRENKEERRRTIILIAKNHAGYKNILALNKKGFDNPATIGKKVFPLLDWKLLEEHANGIICLTGDANGIVGQLINAKNFDGAETALTRLHAIYGDDLGAEVQTHHLIRPANNYNIGVNQQFTNVHVIRLAKKLGIRVVPTNAARYMKKEEQPVHDALLAVGAMQPVYSNARTKYDTSDLYLKSYEETKAFFSRNFGEEFADSICANTVYFADKCDACPDWIEPKFSNPSGKELPTFPVRDEPDYGEFCIWMEKQSTERKKLDEDKNYLRFKCEKALMQKGLKYNDEYVKRFEYELDVMYYCGTSSYMLITADFMNWARKNDIATSAGRGSAGGSLIGYLLGIHQADPIKYGLVFERFYSKKRNSFADIDNDVSKEKRDKVLQYIVSKYGIDKFAQITNNIYITPKVYARDICRSLELGGDRKAAVKLGNDISEIIPKTVDGKEVRTYKDVIKEAPLFSEYIKRYPQLETYSAICGKPRSGGIHASGILIGARPIAEVVPIRIDKDNVVSTQFDKDRIEEAGLVKIDVLGLETLDIIEATNELIRRNGKQVPKINYDEYDKPTYDLIASGNTFGVFQLGISAGTIELCKRIKPKSIDDLATINTIARPAAKAIRHAFIKARNGKEKNKLIHPSLENALKNTYGFLIYDEQLLTLAKDVAGWDLDEADKLRKLTKEKGKNPEKAEKWRQEFIQGAVKSGISSKMATNIWHDVIENCSSYLFNKSHSILYSMTSYHTAYLKAHFPMEFLLANLMFEIRSAAKVAKKNIEKIKQEIRAYGVKILPPNINTSSITYQVQKDGTLLTGFEALKNVGDDAIKDILEKRPFTSFDDFMLRADTHKVRANTVQALAASGCLDDFGIPRRLMCLYVSDYKKKLQVWLKKHDPSKETFEYPWAVEKEWAPHEIYILEKEIMGEAFSFGIKEGYRDFFDGQSTPISKIRDMDNKTTIANIKGVVKDIFEFRVKKETSKYLGQGMIKARIEDEFGDQIGITIFPDKWKETKDRIKFIGQNRFKFVENMAIHISGTVNEYEDEIGVILEGLQSFRAPPQLPKDLKEKKTVKLAKKPAAEKKETNVEKSQNDDIEEFIGDIEDELFEDGLIDLEGDEENDD